MLETKNLRALWGFKRIGKRTYVIIALMLAALFSSKPILAQNRADTTLMRYLQGEGLNPYPARDIAILTTGHDLMESLFHDIDNAKRKVWIEFFIIANDSVGKLCIHHLEQAARRGCEVRMITDDYKDWERGYGMRTPKGRDSIRSLGIDFVTFDRFRFPWVNHLCRDHRKVVNIDDSIGYIGGFNIADYYVHGNPSYGGWRDTHIRITGAAVEGLARMFHKQYQFLGTGGKGKYTFSRYLFDRDYALQNDSTPQIVYFERGRENRKKKAEARRAIIAAFDAARDTIRLVSPYLLPTHTVRQALIRAIDRGVHVEILFSKKGDMDILSYGNYHFSKRLVRHGAHVFLYRGDFHHSKIMMIDGRVAMVGSVNMNSRSLKWDYEAACFVFDRKTTGELTRIFENDKLKCDTFSLEYYKREFPRRFRHKGWWVDRFLTPFF